MITSEKEKEWKITFYSVKVRKKSLSLPAGILADFLRLLDLIMENGPNLGMPYTASMGDGLFEIRAKGKEGIGRVFFCILVEHEVCILHSFVKKRQKTPKKDLDIARKRKKELS
jgi:phage-related protein